MQSDGNSFCGDFFLENVYNASLDEENTIDQIYKCKYIRLKILILYNIIRKCLCAVFL